MPIAEDMKRVIILGGPGSGKSTLARQLSGIKNLPAHHLDQYFWSAGWVKRCASDFDADVTRIAHTEEWVIEGNYKHTLAQRLERADTVLVLQIGRMTRMIRVIKRYLLTYGRTRQDMAADCPEQLDREFASYVWNYQRDSEPAILNAMAGYEGNIIMLKNAGEVRAFLNSVAS